MQNTDATYKSIYESGEFYTETRVTIGEANHIVTEEDLVSVKSRKRVFNGDNPEVGCCVCGELFLQMYSPPYEIEKKAKVTVAIRLVSNIDGSMSNWLPKGTFYIDTRQKTENRDNLHILTLHCYDAMIKAEQDYGDSTLEYPTDDLAIVNEIAQKLGVLIDERSIPLINKCYAIQYPSTYSVREVLGFVGSMYAGNWIINDNNKLQLIPFCDIPDTNYLIDEYEDNIVFGTPPNEEVRILVG